MSSVSEASARELIGRYEPMVRRMAGRFRFADHDELQAVGVIGIIEASISYRERHGVPLKQWTALVVRQRMVGVMQRAQRVTVFEQHSQVDYPTNGRHDPERSHLKAELMNAVAQLSPRHQAVISGRIRGQTFAQIGEQLGISTQRVQQEEKAAVLRLRQITDL